MRTFFLLILLLILSLGLSSQNAFNKAYQDINEVANPFVFEVNNCAYFTTTLRNADHVGETYLYKHNQNGVLHYRKFMNFVPSHGYKTLDNKLLFISKNPMCDVQGPLQINYINKRDTAGNSIFLTTYTVSAYDNYIASFQYTDSSYFSFTDSVLFKNSKIGAFVSKTNLNLKNISSALLLQNNTILLSAKQSSITSLVVISPSGATLTSKPFPVLLKKLCFYGGQNIAGLGSDGKIYKISQNLDLINNSNFVTGNTVTDFLCRNDTLYSILTSTNILASYAVTDTLFNTISLTSTTTQSITQNAICLNASKTVILSNSRCTSSFSWPGDHYFTSLSQINKLSSNNFTKDIALVSITADTIYAIYSPSYRHTYLKAKVKIKNTGATTINKFKLNSYMYPRVDCGAYYYHEQFNQLSVLPGDSAIVTTGFIENRTSTIAVPGPTVQYCLYTTLPNGETDATFADNTLCKTFTVSTDVSLRELNNTENKLSLFPNPFNNYINIESEFEIKNIEIFNSIGELLFNEEINKNKLSLNKLTLPGLYFINIETEKGIQIKKVVKQ